MANHPNRGSANRRLAEAAGYTVTEGAYHNTSDDRMNRWYVQHRDDEMIDRRGPGHFTPTQAWAAAAELVRDMGINA